MHACWKAQVPGAVIAFNSFNLQKMIIFALCDELNHILQISVLIDTAEPKIDYFRDMMQ